MKGLMQLAVAIGLLSGLGLMTGCGDAGKQAPKGTNTVSNTKKEYNHSGWWCDEHGIPEEECSMCSAKVAKAAKEKGDWCELHSRAKSQCFKCDPKLQEQYAARYRTKYGKEPPAVTD